MVDEATMISFMRYNDFQNDPDAVVEGCNVAIPAGSVANRLDLTLPGDYIMSSTLTIVSSFASNVVFTHLSASCAGKMRSHLRGCL